jgi:hypothetical protein
MHVFTFRSRVRPDMTGFTSWRTGGNLPEDLRPWVYVSEGAMHAGEPVNGVYRGADTVLAGILRDGFYIARAKTEARPSLESARREGENQP